MENYGKIKKNEDKASLRKPGLDPRVVTCGEGVSTP